MRPDHPSGFAERIPGQAIEENGIRLFPQQRIEIRLAAFERHDVAQSNPPVRLM